MLTIKNGILSFQRNNGVKSPSFFYEICLYVLLTGYFIFYSQRILMIICVATGVIGTIVIFYNKARDMSLHLPVNSIWYLLFFGFAEASSLWAVSASQAFYTYMRVMILILILSVGIPQYVSTVNDLTRVMKIFMLATLTCGIVEFIMTPLESIKSGYLGGYFSNNNSNTFGYIVLCSTIMSFYLAYVKRQRIWYLLVPVFFIFCVLSSSRKAMLVSLFGVCLVVFFSFGKKHHWLHLAIMSATALILIILSLKVDFLYEIIGYRIATMLDFYQNDSQYTQLVNSLALRDYFIEFAKQLFHQKPIIGHGFANFATMLYNEGEIGGGVYAHNNYWEILADLGIIGFIIYYWFYAYLIVRFIIRLIANRKDKVLAFSIPMIISVMLLEWGVVSMASFYPQLLLSILFTTTYAENSSAGKRHRYSPALNGGN